MVNHSLVERVREYSGTTALFARVQRVLVGFSGGADSTALLLVLRDLEAPGLTAVHVHHGLRGAEADADAAWCERFCRHAGVPFRRVDLTVSRDDLRAVGMEAAARQARLRAWHSLAGDDPTTAVALGHHRDDAVETLFLRLARGSNSTGLTGLRAQRCVAGVRFLRPLLCAAREDIERFLHDRGVVDWRCDETNQDTRIQRNAVRRRLLPLFAEIFGGIEGLPRSLNALQADAALLEAMADDAAIAVGERTARWRELPDALLPRVLRRWLSEQGVTSPIATAETVARLHAELLRTGVGERRIPLGRGIAVQITDETMRLTQARREVARRLWHWQAEPILECPECDLRLVAGTGAAEISASARCEVFRAAALPETLLVRPWEAGDRMQPFGGSGTRKLQDIFTDAHIPRSQRHAIPVVCAGNRILWVAGVARAEYARVDWNAESVTLLVEPLESGPQ